MSVFISWSGPRSRAVANALRDWLKNVIQAAEPWCSDKDIDAGKRWSPEIAKALDNSNFGIVCLTPENMTAPWILFEAGAIAKHVKDANAVPYLLDIEKTDLTSPLADFQAVIANEQETRRLAASLNRALGSPLAHDDLNRSFDKWWPELEVKITAAREIPHERAVTLHRERDEMLKELLELVRNLTSQTEDSRVHDTKETAKAVHQLLQAQKRIEKDLSRQGVTYLGTPELAEDGTVIRC